MKRLTQKELISRYFVDNACREIEHAEVVDWATQTWQQRTGNVFRDPDRAIRSLHSDGILVKVRRGVYKYDPRFALNQAQQDFTDAQKNFILQRDGYKCSVCGKGRADGIDLHVDHIKPKMFGGQSKTSNGQVLCATHNFRKKHYSQTESGKSLFINLLRLAEDECDDEMSKFCKEVLEIYEKHGINGHISW